MVSIIYVNWNTSKWLDSSVELIEQNPPKVKYEIIVIDNGSHSEDGFFEWTMYHPEYRYIFNQENMGFGFACNQAILISKGKYICLLNTDTKPEAGWLDYLVEYLDNHPECGLVAPSMTNVAQYLQDPKENKGRTIAITKKFISFACVVIPKRMFVTYGLLSMVRGEDVDFCKRLSSNGKTLVVVGKAYVFHYGGESVKKNNIRYKGADIQKYLSRTVYPKLVGE
jgi:GT2 family glycosyltransferase